MRPATGDDLGMAALVLSWGAVAGVVGLVGMSALSLGLADEQDWAWLGGNAFGMALALWAARRPSWASGLVLSTIGYVPLVYSLVGMVVLPVVLGSTLVLVERVRAARASWRSGRD